MRIARGQIAVVAAGMCAFFNMYITQALLPELRRAFGAGVAQVSLTVTATTLGVALAAPFAGSLADRYGRKRVLLCALALLVLATFGAAGAASLEQLLLWRALQGLVIPGIFTSTVAYIAEEWAPAEAVAVTSLYVAGTVLGSFCGRFISGLITAEYGWRAAFLAMGGLNLAFLPLIAWLLPRSRRFAPGASLSGVAAHLRNAPLLATYGVGFSLLFAQVGTFTWINFHLSAAPFNLGTHALSCIFFVFLVGMAVTPFSGRWALRWGSRAVGLAALGVSALGLLLTLVPWLPAILLGLVLSSGGVFIVQSQATAAVPRLALGARSAAVGLYLSCYYFGGSVGASLPAAIWSVPGFLGGWNGCVALVLAVQAGAALLIHSTWSSTIRSIPAQAPASAPASASAPAPASAPALASASASAAIAICTK